jgi:hypothetical protein
MIKNPKIITNIEKVGWQAHEFIVDIMASLFSNCKTIDQLGIFPKDDPTNEKIIKSQISTDFILDKIDSCPDILFLVDDRKDDSPSDKWSETSQFLMIELKEREMDFQDIGYYIDHLSVTAKRYSSKFNLFPIIHMAVIYGPRVMPFSPTTIDLGFLRLNPTTLFINNVDKEALFEKVKTKASNNEKPSPLEILSIAQLPGKGEYDKDVYEDCMSLLQNLTVDDPNLASSLIRYMEFAYGNF